MPSSNHDLDTPLYDPDTPIACTAEALDIPDHVLLLERIRGNLERIERTPHGVLLTLPSSDDNAADVRRFAAEEKRCCEFWGFAVGERPQVTLRWDGPPGTNRFMGVLIDYFEGRQPIGSVFGPF
jgi:hypothetical protein